MIAALVQCAVALAVFLLLASLPFGGAGRPLRHAAFGLVVALIGLAMIVHVLRAMLPVLLADWRFYGCWLVASPIAYVVLQIWRRSARTAAEMNNQRPSPPKRREGVATKDRGSDDGEQVPS